MSGGANGSSLAILTVDAPQLIFTLDPVFALLEFFTSPNSNSQSADTTDIGNNDLQPSTSQTSLVFRVDLHDVSISVLEDDADPNSQAISLTIEETLLSQQVRDCKIPGIYH